MDSDEIEMTLYDYLIFRQIGVFPFPAFTDSHNNTNPDSSERSDPLDFDQTEMPQMTLDEYINNSRNMDLSQNSPIDDTYLTDSETNTDPDQDSSERSDPLDSDQTQMTLDEYIRNSRNMDLSQNSPIDDTYLTDSETNTDPDQDSSERSDPIIFVIQGSVSGMNDLLLPDLMTPPDGPLPASKASIEAMQSVETKEDDECLICMDDFMGELAKEMPCKHKFHGGCVEEWLKINGSCPVCRYKMPVDDDNELNHKNIFAEEGRQIWVSIFHMATDDSDGPEADSEMQGLD